MSITNGQPAVASDFITEAQANATPANDSGRVPKLESDGNLSYAFLPVTKPVSTTFTEAFPGANRELNGDNGWVVRNGATGVATNLLLRIASNYVETIGATSSFAMRALLSLGHKLTTFPFVFSCDLGMLNTGRAYGMQIVLGASLESPGTFTLFLESGISVRLQRSDSADTTSTLEVYDGSTLVATDIDVAFDYDVNVSFQLTINADGSGSVVIYNAAGLTGTSDTLSWSARQWEKGQGNFMGFNIGTSSTDGTGGVNRPKIDNISFAHVSAALY